MSTTQSGAVLYQNPLRPFFVEDTFPIVYSNDIEGGIHGVTSSQYFSEIAVLRRKWGMLVHTYNENKYYQLYPFKNTDISDDDNWILLSIGAGSAQWVDSVKSIRNDITGLSPNGGDRYLVGPNPSGGFAGQKNKIAVYNALTAEFSYVEPVDRSTLRVEADPYSVYTFLGTNSNAGSWSVERQNTVRYIYPTSDNGRTFSYISPLETILTGYTYSVYIANFATSNSGTVSISIDGNAYIPVKKVSSNTLTDLSANDFGANVDYMLSYRSGVFQIHLSGAGSGGTIGPAEAGDGIYTDGLYSDFTDSTPIGTAIDRFNEILKALVPPPAPDLSSWSVSPQTQFVNGSVGYNSSTVGLSAYPGQNIGDAYNKSGYQLGITSKVSQTNTGTTYYQDITGVLNSNVNANSSGSYASYSFGNGVTGSLVLFINGVTASTVDLGADYGSRDTTAGDTLSGFVLTAATNSRFSNGTIFESFWNRTGTYYIKKTDSKLRSGYNFIQIQHILPASTLTLTQYKFIADNSTDVTTYNTPVVQKNTSLTNTKYLSGIRYYTSGNVGYTIVANNVYKYTYYNGSDACTFADATPTSETSTIYNGRAVEVNVTSNSAFSPQTAQIALTTPSGPTDTASLVATFLIQSNRRKLGGKSTFTTTVKRTVQGTVTSAGYDITGWMIDTVNSSSTVLFEDFNDESYRLINSTGYDTISSSAPNWSSEVSLFNGGSSYQNALQVADGRLLYPSFDFSAPGDSSTNPNYGITARDYRTSDVNTLSPIRGGASGYYRTWTRRFNIGPTSWSVFNMKIVWNNTNWVKTTQSISGNSCQLEVKLPGSSSKVTGWLDAVSPFDPVADLTVDGKGCLDGTNAPSTSNQTWIVNLGGKSTANSQGVVLIRITAGPDWNGYIESITLKGGITPNP